MNYEDKQWINRQLFFYNDKEFNTGSSLDISVSCNTENGIHFSAPKLSFKLKSSADGNNRIFSFDLISIIDLLAMLSEPIDNIEVACKKGFTIDMRGYNNYFKVVFLKGSSQENLTAIGIIFSDSDSGKVIIPIGKFATILHLIKLFRDSYWTISTDLQIEYKMQEMSYDIKAIKNNIASLPSKITSLKINSLGMSDNITDTVEETIINTPPEVSDYEKFLDENIDSIDIPELDSTAAQFKENGSKEPEPIAQEIDSLLIKNVYIGDIGNFESMVNSIYHDDQWPAMRFIEAIKVPLGVSDDFKFLPGINPDIMKSLTYLPKVIFKLCMMQYLENNVPFSSTFGIMKYKASDVTSENIELAYDLLLLMAYVKNMRERIETKVSDAHENKSIIYGAIRCFLDPLVFSFLTGRDINVIKNCIITRFRQFDKSGFFDSYKNQLAEKGCANVTEMDILNFVDKHLNAAENAEDIKAIHNMNFNDGKLAVPFKNNYKLEQISKDIVELQTLKMMGKDIGVYTQDKELLKLFTQQQESKTVTKESKVTKPKVEKENKIEKQKITTPKFVSNLHRCLESIDYKSQVPENHKDSFYQYIVEIGENPYVYEKFPLEELGDNVVKALYTWNETEENKKENYSTFRSRLENCMTKDLIIAKIKGTKNVTDTVGAEEGNWFTFDDIKV